MGAERLLADMSADRAADCNFLRMLAPPCCARGQHCADAAWLAFNPEEL